MAETMLAADGTPLKRSLARALRRQKLRALALIAPLLIFVLITFIVPIASMLFRSVENDIVANTLPYTVEALADWDATGTDLPPEPVFEAMFYDMFLAAEAKRHTRLGTRLNYEQTGISSLFRQSGRRMDDIADISYEPLEDLDKSWDDGETWYALFNARGDIDSDLLDAQRKRIAALTDGDTSADINFAPDAQLSALLPLAAREYTAWAVYVATQNNRDPADRDPWESVAPALVTDLQTADLSRYSGPMADMLRAAQQAALPAPDYAAAFADMDDDWARPQPWQTIQTHSSAYTSGYFLNAVDAQKTPEGVAWQPEEKQILLTLFGRTIWMSLLITFSCIALGYPIAWLLANLPMRQANLLLILVLLPFWTSLLVRTSAWKVMLQQQGVINDVLVWIGFVADDGRLIMINNQFGTIVAMTHILLPFMILPMYSVMQTIPPSYLRAAKSLGATNWTAFWRVYFPQSVPGIGAGSILVFILAIGYYITPEIVGGTKGVFISNRIAYHISSSLNWGLAAALGTILLAAVLVLYWAYDKIVGIDNVKLG
ncbi:ABC transporter permease [Tateyamaria omphalii]|uniref:ABC transporter permease n=1 Tax=Tateyamaria omphalii TaxID=299262 RepID=UPI001C9A0EA9|nr:ABC transporter permease [Tateyamaria omphalii]MBY5933600.1 ABC transporter permease [Tateyamaria omphalii]